MVEKAERVTKTNPDIKVSQSINRAINIIDVFPQLTNDQKGQTLAYYLWTLNPNLARTGIEKYSLTPEYIINSINTVENSNKLTRLIELLEHFNSHPEQADAILKKHKEEIRTVEQERRKAIREEERERSIQLRKEQREKEVAERREALRKRRAEILKQRREKRRIARETRADERRLLVAEQRAQLLKERELEKTRIALEAKEQRDISRQEGNEKKRRDKGERQRQSPAERLPRFTFYELYADDVVELKKRGLSKSHIAELLEVSSITVSRAIVRLKQENLLGSEKFKDQLKDKVYHLLQESKDRKTMITNKEISESLSDYFGREISLVTIQRAVSSLIKENKVRARRSKEEAQRVDQVVADLLRSGESRAHIHEITGFSEARIRGSILRIHKNEILPSKKTGPGIAEQLQQFLEENFLDLEDGGHINMSNLAKKFGVSRERIRQLYNKFKHQGLNLPPKENRKN